MKRIVVVALFSTLSFSAFAQPAGAPEFEVASIRVASTDVIRDSYTPTLNVAPGATLRMTNLRLREIILLAYNIGRRQLVGPSWLMDDAVQATDFDRFDIVAGSIEPRARCLNLAAYPAPQVNFPGSIQSDRKIIVSVARAVRPTRIELISARALSNEIRICGNVWKKIRTRDVDLRSCFLKASNIRSNFLVTGLGKRFEAI